jgi:hypothetical protein
MTALTDPDKLRLYLGERIPEGGTDADTFFSDDEIQDLLDTANAANQGLFFAAVLGWSAKAGEYARLIDINESGGDRKLSQRYRQALQQLNYYQGRAETDLLLLTSQGRFAGAAPIDWAGVEQSPQVLQWCRDYNRMPILSDCL